MNLWRPALLVASLALAAAPAWAVRVTGTVTDPRGRPVEFAALAVPALQRGAATDSAGRFVLELPAGRHALVVQQLGYAPLRLQIDAREGGPPLVLRLGEAPVPLATVTVTTSVFGSGPGAQGPVLRRRDVMTTPGATADVFQALRTLPGVIAPAEGAAIYVRGGGPDETLIRIDGVEIGHPYHYERASGGLFGALDPYMLKSALFSSGGFPAHYGGAMSGVLDIQTQDPMDMRTMSVGANMAGGGMSGSWALVPAKLSAVWALRVGAPELLFRLYGTSTEYEQAPVSRDGAARLIWRWSPTGRATGTYLDSGDRSRLIANVLNFKGAYADRVRTRFGAVQLSDVLGGRMPWSLHLAAQRYDNTWPFGPIRSGQGEHHLLARLETSYAAGRHRLAAGAAWARDAARINGTFPADSTRFDDAAPLRTFDTRPVVERPGAYLEDEVRLAGHWFTTLGARVDRAVNETWTFDPRAALAWKPDDHQTVRFSTGRYHQPPATRYLDPVYGNPRLQAPSADHVIAGYEWSGPPLTARLELYRKVYRGLVTNDSTRYYANDGEGTARGVDAFLQGTWRGLTGWASYGWLDAKRRELDDPRVVNAAWDVRHTVVLVQELQVTTRWQLGAHWNWHSGAPFTDVVDRTWDDTAQLWRPVFGEHHAARLPAFTRLDLRATRLFSMPRIAGVKPSSVCAAYVEALNVENRRNVLEYVWNSDWSRRYRRDSYFGRRLLVAGVALTW